ncbi:MAG: hypothetical protein JO002_10240 [Burkholderiaceae bacterium]|nr:hypothetical protein [Burkholderiaceae bacterium]
MAKAGAYVLHLSYERQEIFEEAVTSNGAFSEPVNDFAHARSAPLLCFIVLDGIHITHIASARRGIVAGTGLRRLNIQEPHALQSPVPIMRIIEVLEGRTKGLAAITLGTGGLFTPKSFEAVVDTLSKISDECKSLLLRFSKTRRELIAKLSHPIRQVLGQQKEAVLSAIAFAGLDRRELHGWNPPAEGVPSSFLDGLPSAVVREDAMIVNDLMTVPGLQHVRTLPYSAAVFEGQGKRLTVLLANRLPLENLTGTDLIYFNETHRSFVMVQYKAMEHRATGAYFRLPNPDLEKEIVRMRTMEQQLQRVQINETKENYRLHACPFFIKLCARNQFNPDDIKLFPGMYFSLDHWAYIANDQSLVGPKEGRQVTYKNVGRHIENDFFIKLVANAWVGSHVEQSQLIQDAILNTLSSGRAVALAIDTRSDKEGKEPIDEQDDDLQDDPW